ncbi:hypothetical protein Tco_0514565, partial [Tanacetum coccineum]
MTYLIWVNEALFIGSKIVPYTRAGIKDNHLSLLGPQDILPYLMSQSLAGLLRGSGLYWKLRGSDENNLRCMLAIPLR